MDIDRLETYQKIREEINSIAERMEYIRSAMTSACSRLSETGISGGPSPDKLASQIAELQELEDRHRNRVLFIEYELHYVEEWISTLPANEAKVIRYRYVDGLKWDDVAQKAGYADRKGCWRVLRRAINH